MGQKGNLLRIFVAFFILFLFSETIVFLFETIYSVSNEKYGKYILTAGLISLFAVSAPIVLGFFRMAYLMSKGKKTEIADVFYYFSKKRLTDAYAFAVTELIYFAILFVFSFAVGRLAAYAFDGLHGEFFSNRAFVFTLFVIPVLSGPFGSSFLLPTAYFETEDISRSLELVRSSAGSYAKEISLFNLSFIPLAVLSYFTFGILFFVYLIPVYSISGQLCASNILETKENI
ncbi:MAG: hypothetical protein U0M06_07565 [Clostridia bacterium]|nr:hypothetical protein [Clostridia bacterium]